MASSAASVEASFDDAWAVFDEGHKLFIMDDGTWRFLVTGGTLRGLAKDSSSGVLVNPWRLRDTAT